MKTPSHHLFELVKSLDPREKVFLKIYSKNKGRNSNSLSYLKLFDAIDMLKVDDESLLRARLEKIGFKYRLNEAKNYLAEVIYNSLEEYHSDISINALLQKLLHRAEVLIKKKLSDHANKILLKAEKLALEHEVYDHLIVISSLKTSLLHSTMDTKGMEEYLNHGVQEEKKYMQRLNNIMEFRSLIFQILLIAIAYSKAQGKDLVNKINSILNSPLLTSPNKALSFLALQDYYYIHHLCARLLDKYDNVTYQRQKEWIKYLESDKTKFGERTNSYFVALINLMLIQMQINKADEAEKLYEKIKHFYFSLPPKKRTKALFTSFVIAISNYMSQNTKVGNAAQSIKIWEQIKGSISFNKLYTNLLLHISDNLSGSYFMLGNYHDALKWLNKILDIKEINTLELQANNRIYTLLVHYELSNYDTLPYLTKSSKRFLIKYDYFGEFEKTIINFFEKKVLKTNNRQETVEAFKQLKRELEILLKKSKQIQALEYFDYLSWIESKIENRSFVEIVREKAKKNKNRL